ncbi:hypothetical protein OROMI_024755 [Orobanche minor]
MSNLDSFPQSNPNDPYAIHHSDSPSTVLVMPLLTRDNYASWCRAITMAFRAKSKYGFVDDSLSQPSAEKDVINWRRCNDLVSSAADRPDAKEFRRIYGRPRII